MFPKLKRMMGFKEKKIAGKYPINFDIISTKNLNPTNQFRVNRLIRKFDKELKFESDLFKKKKLNYNQFITFALILKNKNGKDISLRVCTLDKKKKQGIFEYSYTLPKKRRQGNKRELDKKAYIIFKALDYEKRQKSFFIVHPKKRDELGRLARSKVEDFKKWDETWEKMNQTEKDQIRDYLKTKLPKEAFEVNNEN